MKTRQLFILILTALLSVSTMAQFKPAIGFEDLMISAEKNYQQVVEARKLAETYNLPHSVYLPEGIFIEAKGVENNRVVYTIINDLLHPFNKGEVSFWEEIDARFDLSKARVHWSGRPTQNPDLGLNISGQYNPTVSFVMVAQSTSNQVMTFNYSDGTLINNAYITMVGLTTPIEALLTSTATILISGQVSDNIVQFDTLGNYIDTLYGGNTAVLDNVRGIELRPGTNSVVATVGSGTNSSAIPEFDLTTGAYLGNFIQPNTAFMNSPFDIIFRVTDCLVSASSSNDITRYDLSGNHLGDFVASISFPEQLYETASGNVLAAGFSSPSGLYIYDSNGNQLNYFSAVTGLRGAFQLGNGNYLVTSGTGVYVLDQNTGNIVSQPVSGVSGRFIREFDLSIVPVELTAFTANVAGTNVELNWITATEVNNQGFEIERSEDNVIFNNIGFVSGFGTTTEPKSYSYTDQSLNSGTYYYRLKQIDFDGSFNYSDVVEVDVSLPSKFALEQNYPNPFNPSTSIQFSLPVDAQVTIGAYNLVGEKVSELIASGNFSSGSHNVTFDASKLTSGIYFYRLDATGINGKTFSSVKKMTLLK